MHPDGWTALAGRHNDFGAPFGRIEKVGAGPVSEFPFGSWKIGRENDQSGSVLGSP